MNKPKKSLQISAVNSNFEREPLRHPFGFKGSAMTNVWQIIAKLEEANGTAKIGLGTQNVLWSDSRVFAAHSENGGNALMYAITERALQMIKGQTFSDPISMLDEILPEVLAYGKEITGLNSLRKTFALNALVPVDNAAWLLYAAINGIDSYDNMVPSEYRPGLSARHDKVISIPALGYGTSMETIKGLADRGFFIMKIKIGAPGDQKTMLEKDKAFLKGIHETIGHYETPHSPNGKIPYYFDANGRYESQDTLHRFLDYAEQIGALDQIAVLEEPFGEHNHDSVSSLTARGPRVAADESAHTDEDAISRIEQGYNSIAVKAIAKTMSMTMKIAQAAYERNVPCFCADLTVNPILVDWNKMVAARLPAFPGWNMGMQETNGWQNYRDWEEMLSHHPQPNADWVPSRDGLYDTGAAFNRKSGGIFAESEYYKGLV
ncbi:enolase-like domain-containing protein [Flavilitoribacter nigricans]|uniref:L-alanine-DL-glutamate epimerase n=1 Tax=Flavilitoribacter nigricans (strain ATCC 23147 / DSM 23189 / NBRC 102662 / NCIMB 1420 / SS-2) TaxID=1122177 RepID=A0A2D0NDA7_FLAN2|nr:L-alanine-DL-glutamate epimerase [Flavilitoribacter nigricans]PHN06482.1 L-alanine-DL-glutamate epimerase [Flavilitoribacter nigricans DSM 23189 = NBRC 102662]